MTPLTDPNATHQWVPGVDKSLLSELLTEFNLSPRYIDRLSKYYILHWSGEWFANQSIGGLIMHQGDFYVVCYRDCSLREASQSAQVALSFRKLADESYPYGYVMVKCLTPSNDSRST